MRLGWKLVQVLDVGGLAGTLRGVELRGIGCSGGRIVLLVGAIAGVEVTPLVFGFLHNLCHLYTASTGNSPASLQPQREQLS
jgi:hypothetical protein